MYIEGDTYVLNLSLSLYIYIFVYTYLPPNTARSGTVCPGHSTAQSINSYIYLSLPLPLSLSLYIYI